MRPFASRCSRVIEFGDHVAMPDEHRASTEHALLQEIAAPLASLPDDPVSIAADPQFPVVLRGYDRLAVDAYVKKTTQLVAELHATHSPEAAVRRALERVGEEISGILQRAHEAAEDVTARSRTEAEDRLIRAREEAQQLTSEAEQRVRDLDAETDRIWAERRRIVDDVNELAQKLGELADTALERFPSEETDERAAVNSDSQEHSTVDPSPAPGLGPEGTAAPATAPLPHTVTESEPTQILPSDDG